MDVFTYLNENGKEYSREDFLVYAADDMNSYMHVWHVALDSMLSFAVLTRNETDAVEAIEDWCRKTDRLHLIAQDVDTPEEDFGQYDIIYLKKIELDQLKEDVA